MTETLKKQLAALKKNAKTYTGPVPVSRNGSSLHQIIKTKKQAERFLKLLKSAS